jgi:low temperature requirement protein LtrA
MSAATPRSLRLHVPGHEDRKPTWLELFYDLIYVAAIIQLGNLLAADASLAGAAMFAFLFVAVWWSWTGMMFYFNRFVADDPLQRTLLFAQMFAIAAMAVSVSQAFGAGSAAFALAYFAVRAILVLLYVRAHRAIADARPLIGRYVAGFGLAALVWLASAFVPPPYRFGLWALGLALEFYVPLSAGSRRLQYLLPPDGHHFAERYGLFTIIVLGESFIKVVGGLADVGLTLDGLALSGLGFVVVASVWWLYFDNTHGAALRTTPAARYVWIYGHLPLTIGITGIGVGLKKLTLVPLGEPAADAVRWVFGGAVVLCLVAFAALDALKVGRPRRRVVGEVAVRLAGAAIVLALVVFGAELSVLVFAALIAGVGAFLVAAVERGNAVASGEVATDRAAAGD